MTMAPPQRLPDARRVGKQHLHSHEARSCPWAALPVHVDSDLTSSRRPFVAWGRQWGTPALAHVHSGGPGNRDSAPHLYLVVRSSLLNLRVRGSRILGQAVALDSWDLQSVPLVTWDPGSIPRHHLRPMEQAIEVSGSGSLLWARGVDLMPQGACLG